MRKRTPISLGVGAIAALALIGLLVFTHDHRHADGAGDLASYGDPGHEAMKVDPSVGATSWTYGVRLCVQSGHGPVTLESVGPTATVGQGFRLLGTGVRRFTPSNVHQPIISVGAWPPPQTDVPDTVQPIGGFVVSTSCGGGADDPYTELLVGLGIAGGDGGGWKGIDVRYQLGDEHHVLVLDHDLMICGASVSCGPG